MPTGLLLTIWTIALTSAVGTPSHDNRVLVVEAESPCGEGEFFYLPAGTGLQDLERVRAVLAYVYNGEANQPKFSFELRVQNPLSAREMISLAQRPDFRLWAGKDISAAISELITQRSRLLRQPPSFFK